MGPAPPAPLPPPLQAPGCRTQLWLSLLSTPYSLYNWLPLLSSLQKPLSGHTALVVCSLSRSLIGVSLSYTIFIYCFHITNAFAGAASISAYVPLKQKAKTRCERNRVALGWGLASARRAVDDPLGSRRGAFSWQALNNKTLKP